MTPPIAIRPGEPQDVDAIAAIVRAAFAGESEAALIEALRRDGDMVAEFVALDGDALAGHIAYSRLDARAGSQALRAVALAPLAVAPAHHRRGIGAGLIEASLAQLCTAGEELAVVLGHPAYYARFGFSNLPAKRLEAPYSGEAFMAKELKPGALAGFKWTLTYPRAFSSP